MQNPPQPKVETKQTPNRNTASPNLLDHDIYKPPPTVKYKSTVVMVSKFAIVGIQLVFIVLLIINLAITTNIAVSQRQVESLEKQVAEKAYIETQVTTVINKIEQYKKNRSERILLADKVEFMQNMLKEDPDIKLSKLEISNSDITLDTNMPDALRFSKLVVRLLSQQDIKSVELLKAYYIPDDKSYIISAKLIF